MKHEVTLHPHEKDVYDEALAVQPQQVVLGYRGPARSNPQGREQKMAPIVLHVANTRPIEPPCYPAHHSKCRRIQVARAT
jgi:hypothetical protein